MEVLKACKSHNIAFVALPSNSTHLTQPLDVAYFRPLKLRWRQILDQWKEMPEGQRLPTILKNMFPTLLNRLWRNIMNNSASNLKAGFKKTGIFPTDETPVLQRLPTFRHPDTPLQDSALVSESFIQFLENKRIGVVESGGKGRKKKLNVPAGKSISAEDIVQASTSKEPGHSNNNKPVATEKKPKRKPIKNVQNYSSETDDEGEIQYASDSTMDLSDEFDPDEYVALAADIPSAMQFIPKPDEYVIVEYGGEQWPGQVKTVDDDGAFVSCMTRCGLSWKWPEKPDCIVYPMDKIISAIKPPSKLSTKRALFRVPELEYKWGQPKK